MTVCVSINRLDPRSVYPVIDPRRTPGPGPYRYTYTFHLDWVHIRVERDLSLSNCQMKIEFSSTLSEPKEIQAWNLAQNTWINSLYTAGGGQLASMTIQKPGSLGLNCDAGADTVVLCRYFGFPRGRTALYTFPPDDFWDFWGGCKVTFNWTTDTTGSFLWGNQVPPITYPVVAHPDGTLIRQDLILPGETTPKPVFYVFVGGADFEVRTEFGIRGLAYLDAMGLDTAKAVRSYASGIFPADGTLVREWDNPRVYVIYGGYRFRIPDPMTLFSLGFDWSRVRIIPPASLAYNVYNFPIDGTLLMEQHDAKVYLSENRQLRWVTSPAAMEGRCLPWRHIRIVPDGSLTGFPPGPDVVPP